MKLARKLLVVFLAVALSVSCFALMSSGTDEANLDQSLKNLKEYALYNEYVLEDFSLLQSGAQYIVNEDKGDYKVQFTGNPTYKVVDDGSGNNMLLIENKAVLRPAYTVTFTESANGVVATFKIKTDDLVFGNFNQGVNNVNGSRFEISLTAEPKTGSVETQGTFFVMDCHVYADNPDAPMQFRYLDHHVNELGADVYEEKVFEMSPKLGEWYEIKAVFDADSGKFSVSVTDSQGNNETKSDVSLGNVKAFKKAELRVNNTVNGLSQIGTSTWLDDIQIYQGTFLRELDAKEDKIADYLVEVDAFANAADLSKEDLLKIYEVYKEMFVDDAFTFSASCSKYAQVSAIEAKAKANIYPTFVDLYTYNVGKIATLENYYQRLSHLDDLESINSVFTNENGENLSDSEVLALAGMNADLLSKLKAAKDAYTAEIAAVDATQYHSDTYIYYLNFEYNPNSKNYEHMKSRYDFLTSLTYRDPAYVYVVTPQVIPTYLKVSECIEIYNALGAKLAVIEQDAEALKAAAEIVCDTTKTFAVRYEAYVKVMQIYGDGVVSEYLDDNTYPGLTDAINSFNACTDMLPKIEIHEAFISTVGRASALTEYTMIIAELDSVKTFMDDNTDVDFLEEGYPGIDEAKNTYNALRAKLATDFENAGKYIAAVNKIAEAQGFANKKAAVVAAEALKTLGNVNGVPGVKEANEVLFAASSEVALLEGYSATLINSVAALKEETDMAKRRELIFIAKECIENCETSITGVSQAKTDYETLKAQYDADVAAINGAFFAVIEAASEVASRMVPSVNSFKISVLTASTAG